MARVHIKRLYARIASATPAPDLHAAMAELIKASEDAVEQILDFSNARWSECEATDDELVGELRAAIAKAKGAKP